MGSGSDESVGGSSLGLVTVFERARCFRFNGRVNERVREARMGIMASVKLVGRKERRQLKVERARNSMKVSDDISAWGDRAEHGTNAG